MKTIEERASTASWRSETTPLTIPSAHVVGYIQGAKEQQEIDIQRACEWLQDNVVVFTETPSMLDDFIKVMKG